MKPAQTAVGVLAQIYPYMLAMAAIVIASNFLVQFPVDYTLGPLVLSDLLTWGAFTYPIAFLVTDFANRQFGPTRARQIVMIGFILAVGLSVFVATPRIAIASGTAFIVAQFIDVSIFNRLRHQARWWKAPLVSSVLSSVLDTMLFFGLAFAAVFSVIGANDAFAIEVAPLLGILPLETPRWMSWALGDLGVKLLVAMLMLVPYRLLLGIFQMPAADVRS